MEFAVLEGDAGAAERVEVREDLGAAGYLRFFAGDVDSV